MKKISSLVFTAVLACTMAVPAFAATGNNAATNVGTNDTTTVTRDRAGMNGVGTDGIGTRGAGTYGNGMNGTNGVNRFGYTNNNRDGAGYGMRGAAGMDGIRANNAVRANNTTTAADDGVDWGWLGLAGLVGLAGLRGRERNPER